MIKAPPRTVPSHLEPRDYCRLAVQYYLMGWTRQAVKSGRLALQSNPSAHGNSPLGDLSEEDYGRFRQMVQGLDTSVSIGEQFFGVSRTVNDFMQEGAEATSAFADELIRDNKALKLLKFGLEEAARQISTGAQDLFEQALEQAVKVAQPPKPVPDGLTSQGYLDLAKQYLQFGWTEQARDSLLKVREMEGERLKGALAWTLLRTQLPKEPLPFLAEEGLAEARRKSMRGAEDAAIEVLEELIQRYPDLELPYVVLSNYELRNGRLEKARSLLNTAAKLNPNYLNTWLQLAKVHAIGGDILESQRCLDRATDLDPDDFAIPPLRQLISILSRL
ncbi:tetratricopeptide repeat protein [Candidatus Obscuribacterales bacterium]|nr:tetratricopeptide repeat protein [Candidatus Obscuribacterales bacterium]MBX3150614.1 tetratricopeptide repeat protein [Candidatus Obscuribacterales bacterium]